MQLQQVAQLAGGILGRRIFQALLQMVGSPLDFPGELAAQLVRQCRQGHRPFQISQSLLQVFRPYSTWSGLWYAPWSWNCLTSLA